MNLPDIRQLVPHSGQMVLLDRALQADADCLVAEVRIHEGSMLGGPDGVGAWVGIEYMAQAISAHAGWHALQRGEEVKVASCLVRASTKRRWRSSRRAACCMCMCAACCERTTAWVLSTAASISQAAWPVRLPRR